MALVDIVKKGSTDRSVPMYAFDNTTGLPKVDLAYNSSGIDLWYRREGAAVTSITEATLASAGAAHSDGGFIAVAHGEYRLDLPDAAFSTGANYVDYGGTATGFTLVGGRVRLVNIDLEDAVRAGLTALPNAAADAAGGLPISDAGGLDLDAQVGTKINDILTDTGTTLDGKIDSILADTGTDGVLLASAAVDAIHDDVVENSKTFRQMIRLMYAALVGKVSGLGTTTVSFRDDADSKDRIVATVDGDGNRSAFSTKDGT